MEIVRIKNSAAYVIIPMVDKADNNNYKAGETVADTAYYKDGAGAWSSLAITDTFTEIGSTGLYECDLTAAEMNHDQIVIKLTASNSSNNSIIIQTITHAKLADIETDTADIQAQVGTAGAGLTDLGGMSTGMKAEIEAECDDAITANADIIAIKAKTDDMNYGVAGKLDANITHVNEIEVSGAGVEDSDEWGPV